MFRGMGAGERAVTGTSLPFSQDFCWASILLAIVLTVVVKLDTTCLIWLF